MKLIRRVIIGIMLFSILIPIATAANTPHPDQVQDEELSFVDKFKRGDFFEGLTIEGQNRRCSVYPDAVRNPLSPYSIRYADPYDLLINDRDKVSTNGLVNIYHVKDNGEVDFVQEIDYGEKITFFSTKTYKIEFYNCPEEEQEEQKSIDEYETKDGYSHGDLICKGGSYIAEVNFNKEGQVSYDKVKSCSNGCTYSYCDDTAKNKDVEDVDTHNSDGEKEEDWSDQDTDQEYEKLKEQLENKTTELEELNELLENRNLSTTNSEYSEFTKEELRGMLSALQKEKEKLENQQSSSWVPTILIIIGVAVVVVYRKRIPVIRRFVP